MNPTVIYKLADSLTIRQVHRIKILWTLANNYKDFKEYEILVRLGDSEELAMATVINNNDSELEFNSYIEYFNYYTKKHNLNINFIV